MKAYLEIDAPKTCANCVLCLLSDYESISQCSAMIDDYEDDDGHLIRGRVSLDVLAAEGRDSRCPLIIKDETDKLAAYEATGLTPEKCVELSRLYKDLSVTADMICSANDVAKVVLDAKVNPHMVRDWIDAEKEGRLVITEPSEPKKYTYWIAASYAGVYSTRFGALTIVLDKPISTVADIEYMQDRIANTFDTNKNEVVIYNWILLEGE